MSKFEDKRSTADLAALREDGDFRQLLTFFRRDLDPKGCRLNLLAWLCRDHSFLPGWHAEVLDVVTALPDGTADLSLAMSVRDLLILVDRVATKHNVIVAADSYVFRSVKDLLVRPLMRTWPLAWRPSRRSRRRYGMSMYAIS